MSLSYVVDGETELDSLLFNPIIDRANGTVGPLKNMRVGIFNALDYVAVGDGVTDDTAKIQNAIDAAIAAGGGVVEGAGRRYKISLRSTVTHSFYKYALMVWGDYVKFRNITFVSDDEYSGGQIAVYVSGQAKGADSFAAADMYEADLNFNPTDYLPIYEIDPAAYLDSSITLATPADAANFAVGDDIYIRTGQTLPISGQSNPDAEYNRITAINAGTGELTLAYPLAKTYAQEYFANSSKNTVTTTSSSSYPAYLGVLNASAVTIRGFEMENVQFEVSADTYQGVALALSQVVDVRLTNCGGVLKNTDFQGFGPHRFLTLDHCKADLQQTLKVGVWASGDRGCGTMLIDACQFSCWGTYGSLVHMNEGCHDIRMRASSFRNASAFNTSSDLYHAAGRGYRHALTDCGFDGEGGGTLATFDGVDGVLVDGCDLGRADAGGALSFSQCQNITLGVNRYDTGLVYLHPHTTEGVPEVTSRVLAGWVFYNSSGGKVKIGTIPKYGILTDLKIYVDTAFNAGSPTIQVGDASSANVWMSAASAVGSQGFATVARQTYTQWCDSAPVDVVAWITPDGSSAGRAIVIATYINGPVPA